MSQDERYRLVGANANLRVHGLFDGVLPDMQGSFSINRAMSSARLAAMSTCLLINT